MKVSDMAWLWWLSAQRLAGKEYFCSDDLFWHDWIAQLELHSDSQ